MRVAHAVVAAVVVSCAMTARPSGADAAPTDVFGVIGGTLIGAPTDVAQSPDGTHLYVVSATNDSISVFARDASTGTLSFVEAEQHGLGGVTLDSPRSLVVSPDGRHVYVSTQEAVPFSPSGYTIFARDDVTGELSFVSAFSPFSFGHGHSRGVAISPDGVHVYTTAVSAPDSVRRNVRNPVTGELTFASNEAIGEVAEGIAISPDGAHFYVIGATGGVGVMLFSRHPATGALTFVESYPDAVMAGGTSYVPLSLDFGPGGAQVYVAYRGPSLVGTPNVGAVAVFQRNTSTGALTRTQVDFEPVRGVAGLPSGHFEGVSGHEPWVAASPDGRYVFVRAVDAQGVGRITQLERDPSTGHLLPVRSRRDVDGFMGRAVVSPDGRHVYATDVNGVTVLGFTASCPPAPRLDCRPPSAARGAKIVLKRGTTPARDSLVWLVTRGDVGAAELGDPLATSDHAFCLYDGGGGLALGALVPAGGICFAMSGAPRPCWEERTPPHRLRYGDAHVGFGATPDGIVSIVLREGAAGLGRLDVRGRGIRLEPPVLPLALPVEVQFSNLETGACWSAVYGTQNANTLTKFVALSD